MGVADGVGGTYTGSSDWLAQLEEGLVTESCTDWSVNELVKCSSLVVGVASWLT